MKAQQTIAEGKYDPADWENIGPLWMRAFDDEEAARQATRVAAEKYVRDACEAARLQQQRAM